MYTAFMRWQRRVVRVPDNQKRGNNQHYELQDGCLNALFFCRHHPLCLSPRLKLTIFLKSATLDCTR